MAAASLKSKHIYGTPGQPTERYLSVSSRGLGAEGNNAIRANSKYFIVPWSATGTVAVYNLSETGAGPEDRPVYNHINEEGEREAVNDFDLHPFNDNLFGTVTNSQGWLWQIPEEGLTASTDRPLAEFKGHDKRMLGFGFHPSANNIAWTYAADKQVKIWDITDSAAPKEALTAPDVHKQQISNLSWSYDGALFATACKDKMLRVFDPRSNAMAAEVADHQGAKAFQVTWLGSANSDMILTAGFSKGTPRRMLHLYDNKMLGKRLTEYEVDASPSLMFPMWDEDTSVVYLCGKGDGDMRIAEITGAAPFINVVHTFKSSDPTVGLAPLPKKSCDTKTTEVKKFLKLCNTMVVPIRFQIPRQNSEFTFQTDLYPDTRASVPSCDAAGWLSGGDATPQLTSMNNY